MQSQDWNNPGPINIEIHNRVPNSSLYSYSISSSLFLSFFLSLWLCLSISLWLCLSFSRSPPLLLTTTALVYLCSVALPYTTPLSVSVTFYSSFSASVLFLLFHNRVAPQIRQLCKVILETTRLAEWPCVYRSDLCSTILKMFSEAPKATKIGRILFNIPWPSHVQFGCLTWLSKAVSGWRSH